MKRVLDKIHFSIQTTLKYQYALTQHLFFNVPYSESVFRDDKVARVQVYSLYLIFKLWSLPHYRTSTFQQDLLNNLKNVAIPGTGLPLSFFARFVITFYDKVLYTAIAATSRHLHRTMLHNVYICP